MQQRSRCPNTSGTTTSDWKPLGSDFRRRCSLKKIHAFMLSFKRTWETGTTLLTQTFMAKGWMFRQDLGCAFRKACEVDRHFLWPAQKEMSTSI